MSDTMTKNTLTEFFQKEPNLNQGYSKKKKKKKKKKTASL